MLPGKGHPVPIGQRIPDLIVGNRLPVKARQLVLPVGVSVSIDHLMIHIVSAYRQVIDGDLEDVPAVVIGVAIGEQARPVFVPGQLAQSIIGIPARKLPVFVNLGDIPQLVVGIGEDVVPVLHRLDQCSGGIGRRPFQVLVPGDEGIGGVQGAGGEPGEVVIAVAYHLAVVHLHPVDQPGLLLE